MNKVVSFELAKLLKEKGFSESTIKCYDICEMLSSYVDNVFKPKNYNTSGYVVSAPTIAEVVMWIYEKYNIWINIKHLPFNQKFGISITGKYQDGENGILCSYDFKHYNSPTEAYEAAIEHCLNNLIN